MNPPERAGTPTPGPCGRPWVWCAEQEPVGVDRWRVVATATGGQMSILADGLTEDTARLIARAPTLLAQVADLEERVRVAEALTARVEAQRDAAIEVAERGSSLAERAVGERDEAREAVRALEYAGRLERPDARSALAGGSGTPAPSPPCPGVDMEDGREREHCDGCGRADPPPASTVTGPEPADLHAALAALAILVRVKSGGKSP